MPFWFCLWDDENVQHLAEHGVTPEEFEEIVADPDSQSTSRTTGRPIAFGFTSAGRYLACVFEMVDEVTIYPITAYDPEE